MKLEIKNLQSSATYSVAREGAVLGREGSKADIVLRDQAVSKRHAKIYQKNGRWYLEDLSSSNGTFLDNRRISEPVVISPGMVFALSENQFEVVQVLNGKLPAEIDTGSLDSPLETDGTPSSGLRAAPPQRPATAAARPGFENLPAPMHRDSKGSNRGSRGRSGPTPRSQTLESPTALPPRTAPPPTVEDTSSSDIEADVSASVEAPVPGAAPRSRLGNFFAAIPRSVLFYLITVPALAVNPAGTVRKAIRDPLLPASDAFALAGYSVPLFVFFGVLGVVSSVGMSLLSGAVAMPLVPLATAVGVGFVAGIVAGALAHPLMKAIIDRALKGTTTDVERSNYYVMSMASAVLVVVPLALAPATAAFSVPFIHVVPQVFALGGSIIAFYVWFAWWRHFEVGRGFRVVIPVLGVLVALFFGWGVVRAVLGSLPASPGASPVAAEGPALVPPAAATPEGPIASPPAALEGTPAIAAVGPAVAGANPGLGMVAPAVAALAPGEKTETPEKVEEKTPQAPEPPAPVAAPVASAEAAPKTPAPEVAKARGPSPDFQQFIERRKAVEEAIEKDPTLLRRAELRTIYEAYLIKTSEIRRDWSKKPLKHPGLQKMNDRLKDVDVYEGTKKLVEEMYAKIF